MSGRDFQSGDAAREFQTTAVGGEYGAGREVSLKDFRRAAPVLAKNAHSEGGTGLRIARRLGVLQSTDLVESHRRFIEKYQEGGRSRPFFVK